MQRHNYINQLPLLPPHLPLLRYVHGIASPAHEAVRCPHVVCSLAPFPQSPTLSWPRPQYLFCLAHSSLASQATKSCVRFRSRAQRPYLEILLTLNTGTVNEPHIPPRARITVLLRLSQKPSLINSSTVSAWELLSLRPFPPESQKAPHDAVSNPRNSRHTHQSPHERNKQQSPHDIKCTRRLLHSYPYRQSVLHSPQ